MHARRVFWIPFTACCVGMVMMAALDLYCPSKGCQCHPPLFYSLLYSAVPLLLLITDHHRSFIFFSHLRYISIKFSILCSHNMSTALLNLVMLWTGNGLCLAFLVNLFSCIWQHAKLLWKIRLLKFLASFLSIISTEDVNTCSFAWFSELVELIAFTGMAMWIHGDIYVY